MPHDRRRQAGPGQRLPARIRPRPASGRLRHALALACLLLASCGDSSAPIPPALPYADPGFVAAGGHRLHYALVMTRDLPSGIAAAYGIVPRRNLALLSITLMSQDHESGARLAPAQLHAEAVALTGLRESLAFTRHDAAGGPTYLATVAVRHRVPVTVEIRARASESGPVLQARVTREFHFD